MIFTCWTRPSSRTNSLLRSALFDSRDGNIKSALGCIRSGFRRRLEMRQALLILAITLTSSLAVFADDQQKADKEIRKINAMAWDSTARAVVNKSLSETLKMDRSQLIQERRELGLNYGCLFVAHELALNGSSMKDIAASLKGGKSIVQISNEYNANWKQIAADGKKLNSKIEDNLYKYFVASQSDKAEYD